MCEVVLEDINKTHIAKVERNKRASDKSHQGQSSNEIYILAGTRGRYSPTLHDSMEVGEPTELSTRKTASLRCFEEATVGGWLASHRDA